MKVNFSINPGAGDSDLEAQVRHQCVVAKVQEIQGLRKQEGVVLSGEREALIQDFQIEDCEFIDSLDRQFNLTNGPVDAWDRVATEVNKALVEFELLIASNPDQNCEQFFGENLGLAYREVARAAVRNISWDTTLVVPDIPRPENAPPLVPAVSPLLISLTTYLSGQFVTLSEQAALAEKLAAPETAGNDGTAEIRRIWSAHKDGVIHQDLDAVAQLVATLRSYLNKSDIPVLEAVKLWSEIEQIPKRQGALAYSDLPNDLVEEELMTEKFATMVAETAQFFKAIPRGMQTVLSSSQKCQDFLASDLKDLKTLLGAYKAFSAAGWDSNTIVTQLRQALDAGPRKIPHVVNCGILLSRGVEVKNLLTANDMKMHIVAEAALGRLDTIAVGTPGYGAAVSREIQSQIELFSASDQTTAVRVGAIFPRGSPTADIDLASARKILLTAAAKPYFSEDLDQLGATVRGLAKAQINLARVAEVLSLVPANSTPQEILEFLKNLAELDQRGITGVKRVFENAYEAWEKNQRGDESETMSGAMVEARVALDLLRHGYTQLQMGHEMVTHLPPLSRYEFDITGRDPNGELVAMEVKSRFQTVGLKNSAPAVEDTQAYKMMVVAQAHGYKCLIVVPNITGLAIFAEQGRALIKKIREATGGNLGFLVSASGQEVLS